MKTTNKISSFINGVVMALAITLLISSSANATWENYNSNSDTHCSIDCSKYEILADKYEKLANKYLTQYNNTHCYTDYCKYLSYANKVKCYKKSFDVCKAKATIFCNNYKIVADNYKTCAAKYKTYADKYLHDYNSTNSCFSCLKHTYYTYYLCYKKKYDYVMDLYNQNTDNYNTCKLNNLPTNSVHGLILFEGIGIGGVVIHIANTSGDLNMTVTTNDDGTYTVNNLPLGTTIISIDTDTLPSGYQENYGDNPTTIDVIAGENDAGTVSYSSL